jgi:phosphoglycolate phosphatase-like HAD superfamily hydrolase
MAPRDVQDSAAMSLGLVGFDLDMTLIDSRAGVMAALAAMADELGVAVDLDEVDRRLGIKLEDELRYWFDTRDAVTAAAVFRRHYVGLAATCTQAMPGAHESLTAMRDGGVSTAIITAKHPVSVAPCLAATGLCADHLFAHVHGPEKAEVLRSLKAAVYVGDTPADMAAARAAGAVGVAVATGSFDAVALRRTSAAAVLPSLKAFPSWYAEFRGDQSRPY